MTTANDFRRRTANYRRKDLFRVPDLAYDYQR